MAALGDLDGDGVPDIAVGASLDDTGGSQRGAVYVLLLNSSGSVKQVTKIAHGTNGGPNLGNNNRFGTSVSALGDIDADGIVDIAVGANLDNTGGSFAGAVYILNLNASGTVKSSTKIASGTNGGPTLAANDRFGKSVSGFSDFDGDGIGDLLVGAERANSGRGTVHLVLLNANGSAKSSSTITGGPTLAVDDWFGSSITFIGDLNNDGIADFAAGA
ncbi:MAG: integrin alpha, partial [Planctomycetota bacterium]|nr:integrin alpha [Planctomycetota bacterium]